MIDYLFDGSYAGYLCCIFESFERSEFSIIPQLMAHHGGDIFRESRTVITDHVKAKRVALGLENKLGKATASEFFQVFLSEDPKAWLATAHIITQVFKGVPQILSNYGDAEVLYFSQTLKKVNRESHRMKAFIRFQKTTDGMYFAILEPDFNVLPLITRFFRNRYADQHWLLYDVKRKYGMLYNKQSVTEVTLSLAATQALSADVVITLDDEELHYQELWKQYFKSTNIEARKNLKLHLQHVPKRYWKYLVEKHS